ncbi:MFS transporter [Granulicoccus sp. GXG6511]|uniref:MFS transporter n=1 Tax=Granulicoccus sp. GXG6511 TaxID=3381351 RepID=UPI003D7E5AAC
MSAFAGYRAVWAVPTARTILVLGLICRAPLFGAMVLLTLHVVERLDPRYSAAGVISMAATIAVGVSGPWRGRLLDRHGLRRTLLSSLIIVPTCWLFAPWGSYWLLLILVVVSGLFAIPVFALVRQALLGVIEPAQRKPALALDSVLAEMAFMTGPALAVWVAHYWGTAWTLTVFQMLCVAGGAALFIVNPPLRHAGSAAADESGPAVESASAGRRTSRWVTPGVLGIFALTIATTIALTATDLSVVAGLRSLEQAGSIGWVLAIWGLGSAIGGLLFGAMQRQVPPWLVVVALGFFTMPVLFARSDLSMAGLLFVAGLFCAPSFTATTEALSRLVPERSRGEAFGWHGSALTAGSALAAPAVGIAIDGFGWGAGFFVGGAITLVAAVVVGVLVGVRRQARPTTSEPLARTEG